MHSGQVWQHVTLIPAVGVQCQADLFEFQVSLVCIAGLTQTSQCLVRPCLTKKRYIVTTTNHFQSELIFLDMFPPPSFFCVSFLFSVSVNKSQQCVKFIAQHLLQSNLLIVGSLVYKRRDTVTKCLRQKMISSEMELGYTQ